MQKKHKLIMQKMSPRTNEVLYETEVMSEEQVDAVCFKAFHAFSEWSNRSLEERIRLLRRLVNVIRDNSTRIIDTIMLDVEKPFCEAETEVIESCDILEYYCAEKYEGIEKPFQIKLDTNMWAHKKAYGIYEPCGVYAVIKPWNYPFELGIWAIAPLLVAGNTIVYKPSELSAATGILMAELFELADFPDGVFNIALGNGETGDRIVNNQYISGISFTGSSSVGMSIINNAKKMNMKISLEMGGSDFALVLDDQIEEITIPGLLWGSFSNAGQVCVAVEKILISNKIYDSVVAKMISEVNKLEMKKEISPIISQKQYLRATEIINEAVKHGCKVLCGGTKLEDDALVAGNYMLPTVIECKDHDFLATIDEIFAPIVFVSPFSNNDEAIRVINSSAYGLGCSIWTGNYEQHTDLIKAIKVGMIWVNEVNLPMPQVPWAGIKISGVGLNLSKKAVYDSMNMKVIHIDNDKEKRSWWYPYTD